MTSKNAEPESKRQDMLCYYAVHKSPESETAKKPLYDNANNNEASIE